MDRRANPPGKFGRQPHANFHFAGHKARRIVLFLSVAVFVAVMVVAIPQGEAMNAPPAADTPAVPGMLAVGETLEYEVSYSIFALGKVKLQVLDTARRNGALVYRAQAYMDSYNVPFVNLHWLFYSELDPDLYSRYFSGVDLKDSSSVSYANYAFDYDDSCIRIEEGIRHQKGSIKKKSDTISTIYQDGLSLFYFARGNVHANREMNVPTFVDGKKVNTYINFMDKETSSEIDAVKYPIGTIEFNGRADFVGIFGLTGGFSGWFSNDEAAIPIVAKMKVIIGSIRLELVKWDRPGWVPPHAAKD